MISDAVTGRGIYASVSPGMRDVCLYHYRPGDCWAEIQGLGIAIRHSNGTLSLVGPGIPGQPAELAGLRNVVWHAACA